MDPEDEVTLALDEAGRLEIAVTSAQRRHLQSLRLRVLPSPPLGELHNAGFIPQLKLPAGTLEAQETSDGGQRLTVTGLARGIYSLWIEAADHAPAYAVVRVDGPEPARIEVALRPAVTCTVQVHDHRGQPVEGARIFVEEKEATAWSRALSPRYGGLDRWQNLAIAAGRTDATGRLALQDLPPPPTMITARHPAWGCASVSITEPQETIELVMEQPGSITGQIFTHGVPASPRAPPSDRHRGT